MELNPDFIFFLRLALSAGLGSLLGGLTALILANKKKTTTREDRYPNRPVNKNVEYYTDANNQIKRRTK